MFIYKQNYNRHRIYYNVSNARKTSDVYFVEKYAIK
jgi:hypothetical protein